MGRPPLVAPLLGRCPRCRQVFKGAIDLRVEPPRGRAECPWCHAGVDLAV